jgi:hypothetical protein
MTPNTLSAPVDLSIIIVNWNSKDYLQNCIASILAETNGIHFEIIVIDSGSFDGCGEMLREHYPQVRFIQSEQNIGFAKANNQAFLSSHGEIVLFLNPDTEVTENAIEIAHKHVRHLPAVGVVGCKLLNSDNSLQATCIRAFPTLLNQLLESDLLRRLFPKSRLWGMAPLYMDPDSGVEVDAVSGAFQMMRRSVFEQVGMFTTKYFMYSEDIDLCFKTRKSGLANYYIPTAVVVHHGGGSTAQTGASTFSIVMMLESRRRFFVNTRSWFCGWSYRTGMCMASALRLGLALVFLAISPHDARIGKWSATVRKWWAGFRWAVGLERWVENY